VKGEGESQRLRGKPTQKRTKASSANRSERRMLAVLSWVIRNIFPWGARSL